MSKLLIIILNSKWLKTNLPSLEHPPNPSRTHSSVASQLTQPQRKLNLPNYLEGQPLLLNRNKHPYLGNNSLQANRHPFLDKPSPLNPLCRRATPLLTYLAVSSLPSHNNLRRLPSNLHSSVNHSNLNKTRHLFLVKQHPNQQRHPPYLANPNSLSNNSRTL